MTGSQHPKSTENSIERGVEQRLARLETLVWVLCIINLPEVLTIGESLS